MVKERILKNRILKVGTVSLMVILAFILFLGTKPVLAASKAANAKAAYRNFMNNIMSQADFSSFDEDAIGDVYFAVIDISGDKVPELLVKQTYTEPCGFYVYSYQGGKVKKLKRLSYYDGGEPASVYSKTHIIKALEGDSWSADYVYYKISGKKMKRVAHKQGSSYYVNGKKVSENKYNSYIEKLETGKEYSVDGTGTKLKLRKNTEANRDKYLK